MAAASDDPFAVLEGSFEDLDELGAAVVPDAKGDAWGDDELEDFNVNEVKVKSGEISPSLLDESHDESGQGVFVKIGNTPEMIWCKGNPSANDLIASG